MGMRIEAEKGKNWAARQGSIPKFGTVSARGFWSRRYTDKRGSRNKLKRTSIMSHSFPGANGNSCS